MVENIVLEEIEVLRHEANKKLDPKKKAPLGQFMTPYPIAEFMASLFTNKKNVVLLDGGAGIGSLTMACSQVLELDKVEAWEIDPVMLSYLEVNLNKLNVPFEIHPKDFILDVVERIQARVEPKFTNAILNPPYKKINQNSEHRLACRDVGIETVNLYTCFFALAIKQMKQNGEIVIIIPRSFCNGAYYKPFREFLLNECSIDLIHNFESRKQAFKDDEVLQENVIFKVTKGKKQGNVIISYSHDSTFKDITTKEFPFDVIVKPKDKEFFIHIPTEELVENETLFEKSLAELGISASTGPVVDFRVKEYWSMEPTENTAPLLYPHHFTSDGFQYPKTTKKPNGLVRCPEVDKWLMKSGNYVIVKRFSAKEERRRVVAYIVDEERLPYSHFGFENHWNVFHIKKSGLPKDVAKGLACFLNSTILDDYFRVFSGHTQVNATDLKNMKYPNIEKLKELGKKYREDMNQEEIDKIVMEL
ncbi:MAG: Eco57I restriction-modification methylase domain-containing protein [Flavobacterium sp.]|nr:Eco57I restriction-modification methylase domain-containing protein [Flavobacterium sp.]